MTLRRKQNIQLAIVGGILLAIILMTVFAPWLAPYDPLEVRMEDQLLPPCLAHPLGTDALGRDVLSRVIYGGPPCCWRCWLPPPPCSWGWPSALPRATAAARWTR